MRGGESPGTRLALALHSSANMCHGSLSHATHNYRIAGNIGGELYLADWRFLVRPPILNPPILRQRPEKAWRSYVTAKFISANCNFLPFSSNPPNIIPANISGYTVAHFKSLFRVRGVKLFCLLPLMKKFR